jgi:hypothetical protein
MAGCHAINGSRGKITSFCLKIIVCCLFIKVFCSKIIASCGKRGVKKERRGSGGTASKQVGMDVAYLPVCVIFRATMSGGLFSEGKLDD